jgi:hypothetical protein
VVVNELRKERLDDKNLFLMLWVILPFIFFSISNSKLPHYILPIFPPLAILTGRSLERNFTAPGSKRRRILELIWLVECLSLGYFALGTFWPGLLPEAIRSVMLEVRSMLWLFVCAVLAALALTLCVGQRRDQGDAEAGALRLFLITMTLFLLVLVHITAAVSRFRSAKDIAENSLRFMTLTDQLVLYDTYLGGLLFYLKVGRPIWLVWSGHKNNIMGSWYVAEKQPPSAKGKVLFTFDEFYEVWRVSNQRLLVYAKNMNSERLNGPQEAPTRELARINNYVLVTNR